MTPNELAAELGISPKTLRAWLRQVFPHRRPYKRWVLGQSVINAARERWA